MKQTANQQENGRLNSTIQIITLKINGPNIPNKKQRSWDRIETQNPTDIFKCDILEFLMVQWLGLIAVTARVQI